MQARDMTNLSEAEIAVKLGSLAQQDMQTSGILASVTAAQAILESGYCSTSLAWNANNIFGMKTVLSDNLWEGSTWDGISYYTKVTNEEYTAGIVEQIVADFRKYPSIEKSIGDHSAYLLGAMNGSQKRYKGLKGCKDHVKAITIIKNGGYATDSQYIQKICSIIDRFDLTRFDDDLMHHFAPDRCKLGDKNTSVLLLQEVLKARQLYAGSLDWQFGNKTYAAVKRYQKIRGFRSDGICTAELWHDLLGM